jgi:inner membrane protein
MSPLIHGCVGWLIGHRSSSRRTRVVCTVAAVAPDIDGIGLLVSEDLYLAWHHRLAHGVGFAVATAVVAGLACRRERPLRAAALALLAFHSHIVMDLVGSGPGWPILYWWPWSTTEWLPSWQWDLASWQNSVFGLVVLLACLAMARTVARTPVELFSRAADRRVVDAVVARFGTKTAAIDHQQ